MEPATHLVSAIALNPVASGGDRFTRLVFPVAAIAPDFDYAFRLLGEDILMAAHRGLTHSLAALLLTAAAAALLARHLHLDAWRWARLWGAGFLLHLGLDILTPYGIPLLWPLSGIVALPWCASIDPLLLLLSLAGILARLTWLPASLTVAATGALVLALYAGYRALLCTAVVAAMPPGTIVIAHPQQPAAWLATRAAGNGFLAVRAEARLPGRVTTGAWRLFPAPDTAAAAAVSATRGLWQVREFQRMTPQPAVQAERQDDGWRVRWLDARYLLAPQQRARATVELDAALQVRAARLAYGQ